MNIPVAVGVALFYLAITFYLGWLGYRKTKSAADYLVAGRQMHPYLMALAYGSTFISSSAIVGFGGMAAFMGMGLLWLNFLNIFVGIFIAFLFFGKRTRALGHYLDAHTYPELLGKRFNSRKIQCISGGIIFLGMPLYAAAVMIGVARFLEGTLAINYEWALLVFALVIAVYVFFGGSKGIMYTDAFQGTIMFCAMIILIFITYKTLGGIIPAHKGLTALSDKVPSAIAAMGHRGWTVMPAFNTQMWWTMVSTILLGVGIGVLAQPQLAVRYMTVASNKEINRAVGVGGLFVFMIIGVTYIVGSLSNLYFFNTSGKIAIDMVRDATGKFNIDKIIPLFLNTAMPNWFAYIFLLTLLAAAMSTLSGLFHVIGSSFGRDIFQQLFTTKKHDKHTIDITRIGIIIAFFATLALAYKLPGSIIAIVTALFYGLCAVCFLPVYFGALFSKRMNKYHAITSMITGFTVWLFWILFIHSKNSAALGICQMLFGKPSLADGTVIAFVDPIVASLPVSSLVALICVVMGKKSTD